MTASGVSPIAIVPYERVRCKQRGDPAIHWTGSVQQITENWCDAALKKRTAISPRMKRAITVPPAVRAAFVEGLKRESRQAAGLPDPLPMGRLLRVVDRARNITDELAVLAGQNENGYFLDYFSVANDGETNWHGRVLQDGTGVALENYEGQLGFPHYPDDPARTAAEEKRILQHNARVGEILRAKGFK